MPTFKRVNERDGDEYMRDMYRTQIHDVVPTGGTIVDDNVYSTPPWS